MNTPSAFSSCLNQRILSRPGIGWSSPTMAVHKDRRRVSKDNLALAVERTSKMPWSTNRKLSLPSCTQSITKVSQYLTPSPSFDSSFLGKTRTSVCGLLPLGRNETPGVICWSLKEGEQYIWSTSHSSPYLRSSGFIRCPVNPSYMESRFFWIPLKYCSPVQRIPNLRENK